MVAFIFLMTAKALKALYKVRFSDTWHGKHERESNRGSTLEVEWSPGLVGLGLVIGIRWS